MLALSVQFSFCLGGLVCVPIGCYSDTVTGTILSTVTQKCTGLNFSRNHSATEFLLRRPCSLAARDVRTVPLLQTRQLNLQTYHFLEVFIEEACKRAGFERFVYFVLVVYIYVHKPYSNVDEGFLIFSSPNKVSSFLQRPGPLGLSEEGRWWEAQVAGQPRLMQDGCPQLQWWLKACFLNRE